MKRNFLNKTAVYILLLVFVLALPAALEAQEAGMGYVKRQSKRTSYTEWGRDPFAAKGMPTGIYTKIKLSACLSSDGVPCAIINDEIVHEGDVVDGKVIEEINENSVILSDKKRRYKVLLE